MRMADSIYPANLPEGWDAYLAYVDGEWATAAAVRAKFPGVPVATLTVLGGHAVADGCDRENGDLDAPGAAAWMKWRLSQGASRPIAYASIANMAGVLAELAARNVHRSQVRLLSAHYDGSLSAHICGPSTCAYPGITTGMDGTQWTSSYPGVNGVYIDASLLRSDFFGTRPPSPQQWTEFDMAKLPVLRQGGADKPGGGFWSVHRLQALLNMTGRLDGVTAAGALVCDGDFGPDTTAAVRAVQAHYNIGVDGVAGAETWSVLLTGKPS